MQDHMNISITTDFIWTGNVKSCMIFYYANKNMISPYIKEINGFRNVLKFLNILQFFLTFW